MSNELAIGLGGIVACAAVVTGLAAKPRAAPPSGRELARDVGERVTVEVAQVVPELAVLERVDELELVDGAAANACSFDCEAV